MELEKMLLFFLDLEQIIKSQLQPTLIIKIISKYLSTEYN